ncbi:MAG: hypothetical protein ACRD1B_08325 [Thermoanaerobaculia bacterium]
MTSTRSRTDWIAVTLATSSILSLAVQRSGAASGAQQPADPKQQMVAVLSASGPHASLGDQAQIWDRFVGTWDCDFGF